MGNEQRIDVEGRTLKEAIERACEELEVHQRDIEYKLDNEHFRGGASTVKITAWPRDRRQVELGVRARELLSGILDRMGFKGQIEIESSESALRAILISDDPGMLIGKGGQALDALQHVVNKALVHNKGDRRVLVDLENYREKREHSLKSIAKRICEKVMEEQCTITLKPMNAYDRRLVHMEVAEYEGLGSRSLGDGQMKRLQVYWAASPDSEEREYSEV